MDGTTAGVLADHAMRIYKRAAGAWTRGNNAGNNEAMERAEKRRDALRAEADALLLGFGVRADHSGGLMPSFWVGNRVFAAWDLKNALLEAEAGK